jgi:biotin-dependent carboxylase-like uncharacterized protein
VLANRLVGNDDGAAALETTLAGPRLRFDGDAEIALTGATVRARIGDTEVPMNAPFVVGAGDQLRVGNASAGLRTYIAFRGGIDAPAVLGSAATDLLTGLGPAALVRGAVLAIAEGAGGGRTVPPPAPEPPPETQLPGSVALRYLVGPRSDWFTDESVRRLASDEFTVDQASNRIGLRLQGPKLERARPGELPSEGLVPGAIQVPADGRPILLLVDHPTTGGYPVIAVIHSEDLPIAAQLRPGQQLHLAPAGTS